MIGIDNVDNIDCQELGLRDQWNLKSRNTLAKKNKRAVVG